MNDQTARLFDVAGKAAVVTGGTRGIGRMIAGGLADAGMQVYVSSRKRDACEAAASEIGHDRCVAVPADVSTTEGVESLVGAVREREQELHLLINNAGITWGAPLIDYADASFSRVLELNVRAVFRLTVEFLPLLSAAGTRQCPSRVINVSSVEATRVPEWENYAYPASKAAVEMLTRQLARRLAADHVTVNAIAPGPFPSRMTAFAERDPEVWAALAGRVPLGRVGEPSDVVGPVIFLASRAANYLTGAVVPVDGGLASAT